MGRMHAIDPQPAVRGRDPQGRRIARWSTALYALGQLIDLFLTYLATPALGREANPLVAQLGLGWPFVLVWALMTTLMMFAWQSWLWRRLLHRLPPRPMPYAGFYRRLLIGQDRDRVHDWRQFVMAVILGAAVILAYAVIASKLLTCLWNFAVLAVGLQVTDMAVILLAKHVIAAAIGLLMLFLYPYNLQRRRLIAA
jgi:hypothetical protein